MSTLLKLGIPAGSLNVSRRWTCSSARDTGSRHRAVRIIPEIDDDEIECLMVRAQEMARYVEQGVLDAGITGHDWVHGDRRRCAPDMRVDLLQGQPATDALGPLRGERCAGQDR